MSPGRVVAPLKPGLPKGLGSQDARWGDVEDVRLATKTTTLG